MHHKRDGISGAELVVVAVGTGTECRTRWMRVVDEGVHADLYLKAWIGMVQIIVWPSDGSVHYNLGLESTGAPTKPEQTSISRPAS